MQVHRSRMTVIFSYVIGTGFPPDRIAHHRPSQFLRHPVCKAHHHHYPLRRPLTHTSTEFSTRSRVILTNPFCVPLQSKNHTNHTIKSSYLLFRPQIHSIERSLIRFSLNGFAGLDMSLRGYRF
ncbi:hypothetical protein K469DRAFT_713112 [Zopfia rhizophila CBS 207.26]|uniref:Uncharacterized protein n=1 Tax=Zopfia rhizophila CBS 207.26 TaxID=1314779 RepID=A0A6A6DR58_9PEZI|nr:hypothetical protein K469DRAFT_713112 [Zopfia rhizophila CBS 207.26]